MTDTITTSAYAALPESGIFLKRTQPAFKKKNTTDQLQSYTWLHYWSAPGKEVQTGNKEFHPTCKHEEQGISVLQ